MADLRLPVDDEDEVAISAPSLESSAILVNPPDEEFSSTSPSTPPIHHFPSSELTQTLSPTRTSAKQQTWHSENFLPQHTAKQLIFNDHKISAKSCPALKIASTVDAFDHSAPIDVSLASTVEKTPISIQPTPLPSKPIAQKASIKNTNVPLKKTSLSTRPPLRNLTSRICRKYEIYSCSSEKHPPSLLSKINAESLREGQVVCWPHHFVFGSFSSTLLMQSLAQPKKDVKVLTFNSVDVKAGGASGAAVRKVLKSAPSLPPNAASDLSQSQQHWLHHRRKLPTLLPLPMQTLRTTHVPPIHLAPVHRPPSAQPSPSITRLKSVYKDGPSPDARLTSTASYALKFSRKQKSRRFDLKKNICTTPTPPPPLLQPPNLFSLPFHTSTRDLTLTATTFNRILA